MAIIMIFSEWIFLFLIASSFSIIRSSCAFVNQQVGIAPSLTTEIQLRRPAIECRLTPQSNSNNIYYEDEYSGEDDNIISESPAGNPIIRKLSRGVRSISSRLFTNNNNSDDNNNNGQRGGGRIPPDLSKLLEGLGGSGGVISIAGPDGSYDTYIEGDGSGGGGGDGGSGGDDSSAAEDSLEALLSFDLKPKEVVEYLDRFVIKQDDAKKVLAVAICDHYNHCRRCLQEEFNEPKEVDIFEPTTKSFEYAKPNVLLAGPTGVGKTYLLKCLARLVGVPFVKADATKFSETGIVGRDAEDLVRDLVDKAGGNTTLASVGIIYLDEVDKITGGGDDGVSSTRGSFNTRGVQNNFLKLLEDTDVSLDKMGEMAMLPSFMGGGQGPKERTISTRNILFIFSGAFTKLDAELRQKKEKKPFGIDVTQTAGNGAVSSSVGSTNKKKKRSYLSYADTADFIRTGLEPEFVGRVPVRVALESLDADDLKQILVTAEGSVLKQFVRDMEGYSINMTASDDALTEIAKRAESEETGARGLVTILERTLREHKFELPSTSITNFVLDKDTVTNPELGLQRILAAETPDDEAAVRLRDLKRWEDKLNRQIPSSAHAWLTDDAINYLILRSLEMDESAYSFASRNFGEGLSIAIQRISDATSQTMFPISLDVARDPRKEINGWLDLVKKVSDNTIE